MVSGKIIVIMIAVAVLLLGASFLMSLGIDEPLQVNQGNLEGDQQASLNLIINPPTNIENQDGG